MEFVYDSCTTKFIKPAFIHIKSQTKEHIVLVLIKYIKSLYTTRLVFKILLHVSILSIRYVKFCKLKLQSI